MKDYGHLLADDPEYAERAARFSLGVRDVSEVLADAGPRRGAPLPLRVAWDAPCHLLHAQRVAAPPRKVLAAIPELDLVEVENSEECCGGAGIYGLVHEDLGGWIGGDKVAAVINTKASVLTTGNPGCMMQIGAGLIVAGSDVAVVHPVELLDASYRRAGFYDGDGPGRSGGLG
jgi:glycolate oxidase iron-sulfur subunit